MNSTVKKVTFPGSDGSDLAARLDLPAGPAKAFVLFAHCFTCSKDVFAASRIAAALTDCGFGVLRFDFTGLGSSDGEFANTNFSSNLEDLRRAAAWLATEHTAPQVLIGHSLGGAAVLAIAGELQTVRAVATIGAPADVAHVEALLGDVVTTIERDGEAEVQLAGRPFRIRRQFLDDLRGANLLAKVTTLRTAVMILHSPTDQQVGIDHAAQIYSAARHPKSFVALDGADHLLTRHEDATFAAEMIATWAARFIVDHSGAAAVPRASAQVVVAETTQGTFLNHVVAGQHRFLADEPVSVGGFDAGPGPYDLLAAALGACTSMTLRLYADRKKLPLDRVTVEVDHGKVHADDCAECAEGRTGMIDRFQRTIHLDGGLDDEQRQRLLEIADKCPVHRTLEASSTTVTTLADA
jgi:uncharacterized OsmC-like protein/alpha/beta superfamily hydrolase